MGKLNIKTLQNKKLLSDEVGTMASIISKDKKVRKIVHAFQINSAYHPPKKYHNVLKELIKGCQLLQKNKCKFIVMPCNTAHYWQEDIQL